MNPLRTLLLVTASVSLAACAAGGGPIDTTVADTHCGATVVTVDPSLCSAPPSTDPDPEVPAHEGTSADDDDCKYHVDFNTSALYKNQDATVTAVATYKVDGTPLVGATPHLEIFLSDTHPAPNANTVAIESPPGTYTMKPVLFDASGQWTIRFHFFENCTDLENSPHGHVAFLVDVP
jgi:hypothetical protein